MFNAVLICHRRIIIIISQIIFFAIRHLNRKNTLRLVLFVLL